MFAVLKVTNSDTSLKGRIRNFFFSPEINVQKILYNSEPSFYLFTAQKYKNKIPWKEIENMCKKLKVKLILPKGIKLPENSKISILKNNSCELKLLFEKMLNTLKVIKPDVTRSSLCVIDKDGILSSEISKAVRFFSKINIITESKASYNKQADLIMDKWGLSVTFIDEVLYKDENAVIVCKSASDVPLIFGGTVFCNGNVSAFDCNVVKTTYEDIPEDMRQILPEGVDGIVFMTAVRLMNNE